MLDRLDGVDYEWNDLRSSPNLASDPTGPRQSEQPRATTLTAPRFCMPGCTVTMPVLGGAVVKRGLDVIFAASLLLLSLPVLLVSALIIRMTSRGPILFRQVRMGRGFQPFEILKFRTMAHAQSGLAFTLGPDPRITPFGKWLRRTKLDELPQLWNILRGDMSLVGPRPVIAELTVEFRGEYTRLLQFRPGLTDPASLKYSQEARMMGKLPVDDRIPFFKRIVTPDKLAISLDYAERASLWTDLATITMTGAICCFPAASRLYGTPPDARSALNNLDLGHAEAALDGPVLADIDFGLNFGFSPASHPDDSPFAPITHATVSETTPQPTDGCIFTHGLVEIEAAEEERLQTPQMPWIAFPTADPGSQSTANRLEGGASRL